MNFRRHHFLWIVPCVVSAVLFLQYKFQSKDTGSYKIVRITAKITAYDQFQLFFVPQGQSDFTEEYSIRRNILGLNSYQTIAFYIPDTISIAKLRLDIGQDAKQGPIDISEIAFEYNGQSVSVLPQELVPNSFIEKVVDAKFYTHEIDNRFDPFVEFSKSATDKFNDLRKASVNLFGGLAFSLFVILCLWFGPDLMLINRFSLYYLAAGMLMFMVIGRGLEKVMDVKTFKVTIDAIIKKDDVMTIFTQSVGSSSFEESHSLSKKIYGSDERQKLTFVFDDTAALNKVRIDISQNINQLPIEIFAITFEKARKLVLDGEDIFGVFFPNGFITKEENSNKLKTFRLENSYSEYDPFIVSTDLVAYFNDLGPAYRRPILPYLLSFLFTSVLISYLIFNTTSNVDASFFEYGLSFGFVLLLVLPSIDQLVKFKINIGSDEKRALAAKPVLKITEIEKYPRAFEAYYNDHFGFRNILIRLGGNIKTNFFAASPAPEKVAIGRSNWLFLTGESYGVAQDISRKNLLSQEQLDTRINGWLSRRDSLAKRGIKFYKALWPDKHNVYDDELPFSMKIQLKDTISKTDQFIGGLAARNIQFEILDVRKDLKEASKTTQVYMKNDTHWNEYGAFVASQKLIEKISKDFPQVLPLATTDDYEITWTESTDGDLLQMMGVGSTNHFKDQLPSFVLKNATGEIVSLPTDSYPAETVFHRNNKSANELRVAIFRDSFTRNMVKFISPHFKEVLYIWTPYDERIIETYKPDIVIEGFVERYFE